MNRKSFPIAAVLAFFVCFSTQGLVGASASIQVPSALQQKDKAFIEHMSTQLTVADWSQIQTLLDKKENTTFLSGAITQQAYIKASNTDAGDRFGYAVAISGDTLVIGAAYEASVATGVNGNEDDNSAYMAGAVYVFTKTGTTWSRQAYLKASNTDSGDHFGKAVAISGDTIVVGAQYEDSNATGVNGDGNNNLASNSGAAYVFVRNGTTWSQQAYLKASNTQGNDLFGYSVAISNNTIAVGAPKESSSSTGINGNEADNSASMAGAVYVFTRNGTSWSQQAYIKASNTDSFDEFGEAVAISGDTLVIGAHYEDSNAIGVNGDSNNNDATNSGAAYVFIRNGTSWSQQAYLKASNSEADDNFGASAAILGDTIVIGAFQEDSGSSGVNGNQSDNSAENSGAAYVFELRGVSWTQVAYLKASNPDTGDRFGLGIALSDDTIVIGAYLEDSNATGVNGNQTDNSAENAGAAYIFARNATNWSYLAYLKASNSEAFDQFGWRLAVSDEFIIVGANLEDSSATGINGDENDNSANDAGAAFVFNLPKFFFLPIIQK